VTTHPATSSTDGLDPIRGLAKHFGLSPQQIEQGLAALQRRHDPAVETDPIDRIQWVPVEDLDANGYNPNRVHKQELRLLERSLLSTGWIQPILVNTDMLIIDGFHRWRLSQDSKRIRERYRGRVPVAVLNIDRPAAMLMTVRVNRAKGTHVAVHMSAIVRELIEVHGLPPEQIADEMGATLDEVHLLAQDGVFAVKGIADWSYSPAWYPAETSKSKVVKAPQAAPARKPAAKRTTAKKSTTRRAPRK
jgi:hypothetical protein